MRTSPRPSQSIETSTLAREICEQPTAVARLLDEGGSALWRLGRAYARRRFSFVWIAARGTSDNAARYAQYAIPLRCGIPVALAAPSLVTLYHSPPRVAGALVIGISQSGESPDIVETLRAARRGGAVTLAIVNQTESALAKAASDVVDLRAGPERSIAATKTYTTELAAIAYLAAALGGSTIARRDVERMPAALDRALGAHDGSAAAAEILRRAPRAVVLGRGIHLATCHELSLKLKELALLLAEPYSSADFEHGPIAMAERHLPAVLIRPAGCAGGADLLRLRRRLLAKGNPVLEIGPGASIPVPTVPDWLSPLPSIVAGQWLAFHAARARGLDPDRPRGIHKVTRTR